MIGREDLAPKGKNIKNRDVSLAELEDVLDVSNGHKHNGLDSAKISYGDISDIPINYGVCTTSGATVSKTINIANFSLNTGVKVSVKFTNDNTVDNPTLNVNSTGAKALYYDNTNIDKNIIKANRVYDFIYDGTNYLLISSVGGSSDGESVTTPIAKTIIATNNQTIFTYISNDGWTDDLLGLLVFRNGVYMTPSLDYFIDNNNKKITFVTPCVVNEVITVIFNNSGAVDIPFTLPIASATVDGIVTTGNQTFAGIKTFNGGIVGNLTGTATNATNATITNNTASTLYLVGALNTTTGNKSLQTNPSAYVTSAGYLYATRVYNAVYNDYAECFDNKILIYEDVKNRIIELDENNNTILASEDSNLVIGIVSDNYGYLLGGTEEDIQNDSKIPVGLSGVLFVDSKEKVNIKNRGKFISSANEGYAKVLDSYLHGSVVGKIIGIDEINNRYKVIISLM